MSENERKRSRAGAKRVLSRELIPYLPLIEQLRALGRTWAYISEEIFPRLGLPAAEPAAAARAVRLATQNASRWPALMALQRDAMAKYSELITLGAGVKDHPTPEEASVMSKPTPAAPASSSKFVLDDEEIRRREYLKRRSISDN